MKVKKFDNIWTMGLILSCGILVFYYLIKIIFPQFIIEVAHTDSIIMVGRYIDSHKWAWYVCTFLVSFLNYYFYCCACSQRKKLEWKENLVICIGIAILFLSKEFLPNQYQIFNWCSTILIPTLCKAKIKPLTVNIVIINLLQAFTLEIRDLATMVSDYNYATLLVLMIDVYIIQILLYFAFNQKVKL
jgi:hypothetical protein